MLEHLTLWLAPWSACERGRRAGTLVTEPPRWAVLDPATRDFLGLVRVRRGWSGSWLSWLSQPVVEVFETEDDSFLFRTWRSWGVAWHVCDAEGRPAGTVRGPDVRGNQGQLIAVMKTAPDAQAGCWESPQGRELGTFRSAEDGIVASFAPELLDEDPFVRMVLLAALLRIE